MAEKMLKIVQDGRESFIPDNRFNRSFWTKHNSRVAGSYNAQRELVTILQPSQQELAELEKQNAEVLGQKPIATTSTNDLDALKQQVAQMQEMIAKLTQPTEDQPKEKAKPGPKPKTDKDGES
jgi:uncharacterized protein with von Willebrand factor type A (vWA) domain